MIIKDVRTTEVKAISEVEEVLIQTGTMEIMVEEILGGIMKAVGVNIKIEAAVKEEEVDIQTEEAIMGLETTEIKMTGISIIGITTTMVSTEDKNKGHKTTVPTSTINKLQFTTLSL